MRKYTLCLLAACFFVVVFAPISVSQGMSPTRVLPSGAGESAVQDVLAAMIRASTPTRTSTSTRTPTRTRTPTWTFTPMNTSAQTNPRGIDPSAWVIKNSAGQVLSGLTDNNPDTNVTLSRSGATPPRLVIDLGQTTMIARVFITGQKRAIPQWDSFFPRRACRHDPGLCRGFADGNQYLRRRVYGAA